MVLYDKITSQTESMVEREVRGMARKPVPEPADGHLLTVKDLAKYFAVNDQTIRAWINDDSMELPFGRFGKHIRFDPTEIQQWVDDRWYNRITPKPDSDKADKQ